jgi:hypothetical protein
VWFPQGHDDSTNNATIRPVLGFVGTSFQSAMDWATGGGPIRVTQIINSLSHILLDKLHVMAMIVKNGGNAATKPKSQFVQMGT